VGDLGVFAMRYGCNPTQTLFDVLPPFFDVLFICLPNHRLPVC